MEVECSGGSTGELVVSTVGGEPANLTWQATWNELPSCFICFPLERFASSYLLLPLCLAMAKCSCTKARSSHSMSLSI